MIRRAEPRDIPALVELVYDLAEYEKSRDQCHLTAEQLHAALFGPDPALFAHVAQDDSSGAVLGCAIWFLNYSTWTGTHGIYLEDLFVKPEARGLGLGKALLTELAREAVTRGYQRVDWAVLNWNTPSIDFYKSIGAEPQTEWTGYRLDGDALTELGGD
ncbi:GNAT family N-acetyltransferase [Nocardia mexicana]|uniref:L-amino acid N-acyltransferase YncA n=1 Tax=Nocardia mexicana TaxID=279262 RepID=A0A370HAE5_9NOCA|nr:GNAT family N-acetyltransferase [Nocardia mexicana]RDI53210.1 L-amino acid N-acyltransferase YncA [Nocardia mexicana]